MKGIRNTYFTDRFFLCLLILAVLFVMAFIFEWLYLPIQILLGMFTLTVLVDLFLLFNRKATLTIQRQYPEKISNGDINKFSIQLLSTYPHSIAIKILEELPVQFQYRNFGLYSRLSPHDSKQFSYTLRPTERGKYQFGHCHVFVKYWGFVQRRFTLKESATLPCYPSFIQLKKYTLLATTNRLTEIGIKRIKRVGNTMEFERIREYNRGDDYRFINWKATAKVRKVMVNQYQEEKSQPIYSVIDMGRAMRMPFEELTLLDYAINASLVLSNIAIVKKDRAGLLTFSHRIDQHIPPSKRSHQIKLISEGLYNIKTTFKETEFGNLYTYSKQHLTQRALLFLYTNFETIDAMKRQLPYLRFLNNSHIIVVVVFKNTELKQLAEQPAKKSREIYNQIIAEKLVYEKQLIIQELRMNGLQTILTEPKDLTINSINKYLEIKARGLI